jgi:hypothetical protein
MDKRLVSSTSPRERRKSAAELKRMPIEDQLIYLRHHPETEDEKLQALMREDRNVDADMTGEIDHQDLLDNTPPESWGR